jgi:transmembrane sensor
VSSEGRIGLNQQINEEAARWFVEFRSGAVGAPGRCAFDAWVRASPEHLRAFIEIAALWRHSQTVDSQRSFSVEALIESAKEEANVVSLEASGISEVASGPGQPGLFSAFRRHSSGTRVPSQLGTSGGRRVRTLAAAAAALLLAAGSLIAWSLLRGREIYATEVGEQRSLKLGDGSTVTLNSRSRVRIEFDDRSRTVALLEGEALVRVARNPARPFIVRTDGTFVRAVGTEFDVNRKNSGTVVTVFEGRVAVVASSLESAVGPAVPRSPNATQLRPSTAKHESAQKAVSVVNGSGEEDEGVLLSAGEQLKVALGATREPRRTNLSSATAWTQGRVILESATLAEVAEEFNRYSERRLVAEDDGATPLRLSGVFSTDPDFLIHYLSERPDIQVHQTATEIRILRGGVN